MNYNVQDILKNDPLYIKYLRENSHWYKILNRNPEMITNMIEEMKEKYGKRSTDKVDNLLNTIELINAFLNETK